VEQPPALSERQLIVRRSAKIRLAEFYILCFRSHRNDHESVRRYAYDFDEALEEYDGWSSLRRLRMSHCFSLASQMLSSGVGRNSAS